MDETRLPATRPDHRAPMPAFTQEQTDLIRATIAKKATPDEFKLFIYRCQHMRLDPLKPGMVHFVKYGDNPGSIVVGIDGFRSLASDTGLHVGTERGITRDDKGRCIGAWAKVYREGWRHPAHEEVSLAEYTTGKAMWAKMPETMIKKVAEAAALRMAFPGELGGLYSDEEMDQANMKDVTPPKPNPTPAARQADQSDQGVAAPAAAKPVTPDVPGGTMPKGAVSFANVIRELAEIRKIPMALLTEYRQKVLGVADGTALTEVQMKDIHSMLSDETTDAKLLRYLIDSDKDDPKF